MEIMMAGGTRDDPFIGATPGMRCGAHTIRNTRLPVWAVIGSLAAGESVNDVADDYDITRADVLVACWYTGLYGLPGIEGSRRWRRQLREWAKANDGVMWNVTTVDYDTIPDPPIGPDGT